MTGTTIEGRDEHLAAAEGALVRIDDVIAGGKFRYENGSIKVPDGPGLGVKLDRDKLKQYAELYKKLGNYPYDRDPLRPSWAPTIPNNRWADPNDARVPNINY